MSKQEIHQWQFKSRFRKGAFGWKSTPAITRIKEAVKEIQKVARKEPVLAAEGAVVFLEKLSPAIEKVDSSSGAIGTAVNNAIKVLVPLLVNAPADTKKRESWLESLFDAHEADQIPYIEGLTDYWGELCVTKETASFWADRLLWVTTQALSSDKNMRGFFHGTTACLSALYKAERYDEIIGIVQRDNIWAYKRWVMKALIAQGKKSDAIRYAEESRNPWANSSDTNQLCEETLLSSGLIDEAYARYGLIANQRGTYLAWFRAVVKKYPHKQPAEILADLVKQTPGDEGKWFAAAKDSGLYAEAISLANTSPTDPRTLIRAARDYADKNPRFALESGVVALRWMAQGYGYEITGADVSNACRYTAQAAENAGDKDSIMEWVRESISKETNGQNFAAKLVRRWLEKTI